MVDIIIEGKWYKIPKAIWAHYQYTVEGDAGVALERYSRDKALKAIERVGTLKKVFDKIYNY